MSKTDFKPCRPVMGNILKIGVPVAFQDGLIQIAFIVITVIANNRGLNASAAVGIVEKVMSFLFLIPSSMLSTVSALGAQNIGAGKQKTRRGYSALCLNACGRFRNCGCCNHSVYSRTRGISFYRSIYGSRRRKLSSWVDNTCGDMCGIVFLPVFTSASVDISVRWGNPGSPSYIISLPLC